MTTLPTRSILPAAMAALTMAPLGLPLTAQGGVPMAPNLPTNRTVEVSQAFGDLRLADAIDAALNSTDDAVKFDFQGGGSAALIAFVNAGGDIRLQFEAKRIPQGVEIALAQSEARGIGIEAFENLEASMRQGTEKKVVFRFTNANVAATAIECMALGKALGLDSLLPQLWQNVSDARYWRIMANAALTTAVSQLETARSLETTRRAARDAALNTLNWAQARVADAWAAYYSAHSAYLAASDALANSPLPNWMKGFLRDALDSAWSTLSQASSALNAARSALHAAQVEYDQLDALWQQAVATVDAYEAQRDACLDAVAQRNATFSFHSERYDDFASLRDAVLRHFAGVEFKLSTGQSMSAIVGVPGVSLANLGVGGQVSGSFGVRFKVLFPDDPQQPRTMTLSGVTELKTKHVAGLALGLEGRSKTELSINATFQELMTPHLENFQLSMRRSGDFFFSGMDTRIEADLEARSAAGIGWNAVKGVGRRIRMKMSGAAWLQLASSIPTFMDTPTFDTLVQGLQGVQLEVRYDDRWIAGGAMGFGGSIVGYGINFGGDSLWHDHGPETVYTIDAASVLTGATDVQQVGNVLGGLAAQL